MHFQVYWDRRATENGEAKNWVAMVGEDELHAESIVIEVSCSTVFDPQLQHGPVQARLEGECSGYRYEGNVAHVY